jgi:hypothetical protein
VTFANARRHVFAALGVVMLLTAPLVWAQGRNRQVTNFAPNMPYDGRYTFVRIRYALPQNYGYRQDIKWGHDYPRGERHFTRIINELSTVRARTENSNILTLDDPELGKYPIAYLCEAGFWRPGDAEVTGLHNYLAKGGFIIFDDFAHNDWQNFAEQMKRVLPTATPMKLTPDDIVYDTFYHIESLDYDHPYYRGAKSEFWGYFEDNDRTKRLIAVANFNNDLSEYWEFSDEGAFPIDLSNEAYKIGVNYIIYALTR